MSAKKVLVGGPLLGERTPKSKRELKSWSTFEPIIISLGDEQFILLPSASFVTVLAYKTGRRVATFVPFMENEQQGGGCSIESACVAIFPANNDASAPSVSDALRNKLDGDNNDTGSDSDKQQEGDCHVLLVGCSDGTIREFDLSLLTRQQKQRGESFMTCNDYDVPGPCHRPRRVLVVTENQQPIQHLTAPSNVVLKNGHVLLYALLEKNPLGANAGGKSKPTFVHCSLLRVQLPPFDRKQLGKNKIVSLNDSSHYVMVQDSLQCHVGYDKEQRFHNTLPFRLLSVSKRASRNFSEQQADRHVFVVVARSTKIHVYHEQIKSGETTLEKMQSTSFAVDRNNPLSAVSISSNGSDITCGYMEGEIVVMTDVLPQTLDYFRQLAESNKTVPHPSTTVLTRRVHWHAHPVTSLAYQNVSGTVEPMLYSGGFESVLVIWQLSRGTYGPADVLPRLAKGGIVHISSSNDGGILVYCEDNSLQLFAAHNKSRLWKVQGLASVAGESLGASNARLEPTIRAADSPSGGGSNTLILSGLPGAPGYLHWYDTREQRVTCQLEVAPFNRVSRTEHDDSPMPVPSVTHCAFSESGRELVTVDTMPTENAGIGATERLENGNAIGVVSTVRFWSWNPVDKKRNPTTGPYSLTAAMTYPHGEENRVSAVAISNDGQYACTVSNDDNAFRIWHKVLSENDDELDTDAKSRRNPVWLCRFKVTTPSGYSNFATGSNAVGFSCDGSILAICHGNMITLWDHKEATLLTALQHLEDDRSPIESLSFVKSNYLNDLILTKSHSGVALQSPYGKGKESWSCALPENYKDASVTHAELIPSHDLVAVCMSLHKKAQSQILLLDAATGIPHTATSQDGESGSMVWVVPGTVRSIGVSGKPTTRSNWVDISTLCEGKPENEASPIRLYVTMSNGDMLLLTSDEAALSVGTGAASRGSLYKQARSITDAPRLNMLKRGDSRKRRRSPQDVDAEMDGPLMKKSVGSIFGSSLGYDAGTESAPLPSSELPALGGAFTRAFVSRNLASNRQDTT